MTQNAAPSPRGIGGWLALLWFSLTIGGPIALIVGARRAMAANGSTLSAGVGTALALMAVFSFMAGLKLGRTTKLDRIYLIVQIVVGLFIVAAFAVSRNFGEIGRMVPSILVSAIWVAYLDQSVRVRNTYPADFGAQ